MALADVQRLVAEALNVRAASALTAQNETAPYLVREEAMRRHPVVVAAELAEGAHAFARRPGLPSKVARYRSTSAGLIQ